HTNIGKLTISTGAVTIWTVPASGQSFPLFISLDPSSAASGNFIYFTEGSTKVGRLDMNTNLFTEWVIPPTGINIGDIVVDPTGSNVYFNEPSNNKIGRLS